MRTFAKAGVVSKTQRGLITVRASRSRTYFFSAFEIFFNIEKLFSKFSSSAIVNSAVSDQPIVNSVDDQIFEVSEESGVSVIQKPAPVVTRSHKDSVSEHMRLELFFVPDQIEVHVGKNSIVDVCEKSQEILLAKSNQVVTSFIKN